MTPTTTGEAQVIPLTSASPLAAAVALLEAERTAVRRGPRERHEALARLGERVDSVDDLKALIADRKARGGSMPRHDRWAQR